MENLQVSIPESYSNGGKRLNYIDAMRGLAIMLVVFSHVTNTYITSPMSNKSFAGVYNMMMMFRMPLFFFVSGFFAYRAASRWDRSMVRRVLTKKFQAQIFGLAVFLTIYACLIKNWSFKFLWTGNPYWFTESLFMMFCLYLLFALLERKTGKKWPMIVLFITSFIASIVYTWLTNGQTMQKWVYIMQVQRTLTYLPYFLLGIFARSNETLLWKFIDNKYFKAVVIAGFFGLVIFYGPYRNYSLVWDLIRNVMRLTGLFMLMVTFRTYRRWFDEGHAIGNMMCKVGSRTLDIYYMHYLFIPDLSFLKGHLAVGPGNNVIAMLTIGLTVSALIVALCMVLSSVLRSSPLLAEWLFGVTPKKAPSSKKLEMSGLDISGINK